MWAKRKTSGDLDEDYLVDGIAGEKKIFKMRAEEDPEPGTVQALLPPSFLSLCLAL